MSSSKTGSAIVYVLLVLAVVIWGFNFSFVKWIVAKIPPLTFSVARFSLASLLILAVLVAREGWRPIPGKDILKMGALGLIGHSLYQVLFINGISLTTAGNSALLVATSPIWTALVAAALKKDEVTRKAWMGIVLAFVGVFLVTLGGKGELTISGSKTAGDLLTVAAALALSLYTVLARDLLERYSPLRLTAITMFFGMVGLWAFAWKDVVAQDWLSLSPSSWGVIVYSTIFAMVFGYTVWFTAVRALGPTRAAVFNNMTPIIAFIVAFLLLGEPIGWLQVLGGLTVISGIMLTVRH